MDKFFLVQIKRTENKDGEMVIEKGVVVKDSYNDALQSYFAYLGAYGYGHDPKTDYVQVAILNGAGIQLEGRVDNRIPVPQPEPPEPEEA